MCGVEEREVLEGEGVREGSLDVVVCIQVLCAVKDVRRVVRECWRLLRPGGRFVFWEHGGSRDMVTKGVQGMYAFLFFSLTCLFWVRGEEMKREDGLT